MIVHYLDLTHHKPCEDLKDIVNMYTLLGW
uniref:Uncharacterized protein n=1 Tax=Vitis vinifera TaxID=29760 RepID=F6HB45_VITVI